MEHTEHLTDKQRRYKDLLASGMPSRSAAKTAGYSDSYARVAAHRLGMKPAVIQALAEIRKEGMKMAAYGLVEAMQEAEDAAAFAKLHKNPMANVKACELRAKLSGLLIERVEVVEVDLTGALDRARARVLNITDTSLGSLPLLSKKPIDWKPHIPGSLVAKPEAGPTDGQVRS
jgi:phage terminase small subunit